MDSTHTPDRITELEEQITHLTKLVDELNEVVSHQSSLIDRLEMRVAMLMHHAAEAEAQANGGVILGNEKPPHY